eukprot:TRINITY_DN11709_c0_g1_i1.p3 TRINITY_DN11709_c0_g1~~TRINITY_DN11709_c0_g1_i1.p3  ORF type:complete len:106 (+),score=5.76 TRINITY_DN11709_c0_g1_i1:672-989(+)
MRMRGNVQRGYKKGAVVKNNEGRRKEETNLFPFFFSLPFFLWSRRYRNTSIAGFDFSNSKKCFIIGAFFFKALDEHLSIKQTKHRGGDMQCMVAYKNDDVIASFH